jgi:hypothetical protein
MLRSVVDGAILTWATVGGVTGRTAALDSSPWGTNLPPLGASLRIDPGAGGFQELDLDVEATTLKKANLFVPTGIPAAESLAGATLPPSLYLSARPAWFAQLAWPPFDPAAPNTTYEAIPAGYRYMHGVDPPSATATTPPQAPTNVRVIR